MWSHLALSGLLSSKQRLPARLSLVGVTQRSSLRAGIVLSLYSFLHKAELSPCLRNFFVLFLLPPSICICCRVNVDDLDQTSMHCCLQPRQMSQGSSSYRGQYARQNSYPYDQSQARYGNGYDAGRGVQNHRREQCTYPIHL